MRRIDKILNHDLFNQKLDEIEKTEEGMEEEHSMEEKHSRETLQGRETFHGRSFCRHDMGHFLDVARIARIISGEEGVLVDPEWIYAAALLHDIGRKVQYDDGTPHEIASAEIAPEILQECGFADDETGVIIEAILSHRNPKAANEKNLKGLLYRADKASRPCFACPAAEECNWENNKKNIVIRY